MDGSETALNGHHGAQLPQRSTRQRAAFYVLLLFFFFAPFSISGMQIMLALGTLLILPDMTAAPGRLLQRPFMLPLGIFLLFSITAIIFSTDPMGSIIHARHLLLVLVIPFVFYGVRSGSEIPGLLISLAAGTVLSAFYGYYQVFTGTAGGTYGYRLNSSLGHYMTAGGIFMLITMMFIVAAIYLAKGKWRSAAGLIALISLIALLLTQSRNAYVGLVCALVALSLVWKKKLIFVLPFVLSLAVLLSPPMVRERVFSMVDLNDLSIQNRLYMIETGMGMASDFPMFGVGLGQVQAEYEHFKSPGTMGGHPHLHNNVIEMAAERSIPALIAWIWLMYSLGKQAFLISQNRSLSLRRRGLGTAAFTVVVALVTAGFFERNFVDAEVQMLFWALVILPIAALPEDGASGDED